MEAYLDNSSTTKPSEAVIEKMLQVYRVDYGNPSAMHMKGVEAEKYIREAREIIASTLKVSEREILFTSGGTESNNMALIGTAMANKRRGNHIITTGFEHASVSNVVKFLEDQGFEVTYLRTDVRGLIDMDELQKAIRPETILVSIMYVNNEIGAVEPVEEIGALIKKLNPQTIFHVDAIQAYGKFEIRPKKAKIDLLSVSSHKFHGPKGVGFLYIKEKTKINPIILGGGQQDNMRSGTENVPGIAGMAQAAKDAYSDFQEKIQNLYRVKAHFMQEVSKLPDIILNGPCHMEEGDSDYEAAAHKGAPQIVNVSFRGIRSEVLLHALEEKGVYISAGSACSTHKRAPSASLVSIGVEKELLESTVRFSFATTTSMEEIDYAVEALGEVLEKYRKYTRKK